MVVLVSMEYRLHDLVITVVLQVQPWSTGNPLNRMMLSNHCWANYVPGFSMEVIFYTKVYLQFDSSINTFTV